MRLIGDQHFDGKAHFFAAAAEAMRRVLVDHARGRARLKRGGGRNRVELEELTSPAAATDDELLELDDAFNRLADEFPVAAEHLFPPPERALIRAEPIVTSLFARLLLRDDVLAALQAQPVADAEIQADCLKLAGTWPESAGQCNSFAWRLVRDPGRPEADYERGLRRSKGACRLEPDNGTYLNTLGVAQYRSGLVAEALATLTRSNDLNKQSEPADLAFLALAQHRLGQSDKARATLARLREVMKNPNSGGNPEAQAFLHEAETIELDRIFPTDPFAR